MQKEGESNSNCLANQLSIYLILAKQENWPPILWQTNLKNLAKLTSPRAYMRTRIVVAIGVSL
jgi:hypothetical protein